MSTVAHQATTDQVPNRDWNLPIEYEQRSVDINDIDRAIAIHKESAYQRALRQSGERSHQAVASATPLVAWVGKMHDEFVQKPWMYKGQSADVIAKVAEMPIDWKAWAAVMGTIAVKSAGARIIQAERFARSPEQQIIIDPRERRLQHIRQRIGRAALTVGAGFFAYKAGQHASAAHDMATGLFGSASAFVGASYAKHRTKQILHRRRQSNEV